MLQAILAAAALSAPIDTLALAAHDTERVSAPARIEAAAPAGVPLRTAARTGATAAADTARARPFTYSDGYEARQTIHKRASYVTLPLFAIQYAAGSQLFDKSTDAPGWAKTIHGPAATGVAALFAVNSVTGVWNLWEARPDPEGRTRRTVHGLLMLVSDAGFTYTGMLAEQAENSPDKRRLHRQVALSSMGVATVSYLIMALPFWE
jgi:hypothetical protein